EVNGIRISRQTEYPSLVDVTRRCAAGVWDALERAGSKPEIQRGIERACRPQMRRLVADVICRHEPIRGELSLDAQVPVVYLCGLGVVLWGKKPAVSRVPRILIERDGKNVSTWEILKRIIQPADRTRQPDFRAPRRRDGTVLEECSVDVLIGKTIRNADGCF